MTISLSLSILQCIDRNDVPMTLQLPNHPPATNQQPTAYIVTATQTGRAVTAMSEYDCIVC